MAAQSLQTKGAVIFDQQDNRLLNNTINTIKEEDNKLAAKAEKDALNLASSWRSNMLKASEGKLWADQIGAIEQDHLNNGQKIVSRGVDPYTSNDAESVKYRENQMRIQNMQGFRKAMEKEYSSLNNVIKNDPSSWNQNDLKKLNDFISGEKFEDIYQENKSLPIVNRRFDINKTLQGYRAPVKQETVVVNGVETSQSYVDRDSAERGIISKISDPTNPGAAEFLNEITSGYNINTLRSLPNDIESNKKLLEGQYDSNVNLRNALAEQGIVSKSDPRFEEFIEVESTKIVDAKNNYNEQMDTLIASVSGGVTTRSSSKPNYTEAREADRRKAASQRDTRFAERNNTKSGNGDSSSGSFDPGAKEYVSYGNDKNGKGKAPMYGYTKFNAGSVEFVGNNMIDLRTGKPVSDQTSVSGNVVSLGNVPISKSFKDIQQEDYAVKNPDKVNWEKMAVVEVKKGSETKRYLVPAKNLPSNMAKPKLYNEFMNEKFTPPSSAKGSAGDNKTEINTTKYKGVPQGGF